MNKKKVWEAKSTMKSFTLYTKDFVFLLFVYRLVCLCQFMSQVCGHSQRTERGIKSAELHLEML